MPGKYYLVRDDVLPEAIVKTAQVKEILAQGRCKDVAEAVRLIGIARSTYYKYRDGVHPFFDSQNIKIVNLMLILKHQPGVLSRVLNCVAEKRGNILAINQSLPLQGTASVTLSVDVKEMTVGISALMGELDNVDGVVKSELIGTGWEV